MAKERLSRILPGQFISAEMLNFMNDSFQGKFRNLVSTYFKSKGILSSINQQQSYSSVLSAVTTDNATIAITSGSFVAQDGTIVSVPYTETSIPVSQETNILIRKKEVPFIEDCTISATQGDMTVQMSNDAPLLLLSEGMSIITKSMIDQGQSQGLEIAAPTSPLTLKQPAPDTFTDEQFAIIPKSVSPVVDTESLFTYRYLSYEVASTAQNPYFNFTSEWILIATVRLVDGIYTIDNLRVPYFAKAPEQYGTSLNVWLPNIASPYSIFEKQVDRYVYDFFLKGNLTIGNETKPVFLNSHEQNTDLGTTNSSFFISAQRGKLLLGDLNPEVDWIYRIFSNTESRIQFELPSGQNFDAESSKVIVSDIAQQLSSLKAFSTQSVAATSNVLKLSSKANIFVISGATTIRTIQIDGDAENFTGQVIILLHSAEMRFQSGGNIVSTFITDEDFVIPPNEPVAFININGNYYVLDSFASCRNLIKSIDIKVTNSLSEFSDTLRNFNMSLNSITTQLDALSIKVTTIGEALSLAVDTVNGLNLMTKADSPLLDYIKEMRQDLDNAIDRIDNIIPPGTILMLDSEDSLRYFDDSANGKEDGPFRGFEIVFDYALRCPVGINTTNLQQWNTTSKFQSQIQFSDKSESMSAPSQSSYAFSALPEWLKIKPGDTDGWPILSPKPGRLPKMDIVGTTTVNQVFREASGGNSQGNASSDGDRGGHGDNRRFVTGGNDKGVMPNNGNMNFNRVGLKTDGVDSPTLFNTSTALQPYFGVIYIRKK